MSNHSADAGKMDEQPSELPLSAIIGASRRVQYEKMGHSADANKMACRHEPSERLVAFWHTCKHCGVDIRDKDCMACDGIGLAGTSDQRCPVCKGTGIDRWEVAT